jgi:hypothetical protein
VYKDRPAAQLVSATSDTSKDQDLLSPTEEAVQPAPWKRAAVRFLLWSWVAAALYWLPAGWAYNNAHPPSNPAKADEEVLTGLAVWWCAALMLPAIVAWSTGGNRFPRWLKTWTRQLLWGWRGQQDVPLEGLQWMARVGPVRSVLNLIWNGLLGHVLVWFVAFTGGALFSDAMVMSVLAPSTRLVVGLGMVAGALWIGYLLRAGRRDGSG